MTSAECDLKINQMLNAQETWSSAHNSHAELTKFKCLHLTHHTDIPHPYFKWSDSSTVIKCVSSTRLLGVEIDQTLHWRHHVQHAVKKGTALLATINRLTGPSFGLPAPYVHRLFMAIVIPKVEYALPEWYTPVHMTATLAQRSGSVQHTREIKRLQWLA